MSEVIKRMLVAMNGLESVANNFVEVPMSRQFALRLSADILRTGVDNQDLLELAHGLLGNTIRRNSSITLTIAYALRVREQLHALIAPKPGTVGALKALIAEWPDHYLVSLACDEMDSDDVVFTGHIMEGDTSDGPGHVTLHAVELERWENGRMLTTEEYRAVQDETWQAERMKFVGELVKRGNFEVRSMAYGPDGAVVAKIGAMGLPGLERPQPGIDSKAIIDAFNEDRVIDVDTELSHYVVRFKTAADDPNRRSERPVNAHADCFQANGCTAEGRPCAHGVCQKRSQEVYDTAMKMVAHKAFAFRTYAAMTGNRMSMEIMHTEDGSNPGPIATVLNQAFEQKRVHSVTLNESGTFTIVYEEAVATADDRVRHDWNFGVDLSAGEGKL